MTFCVLQSWTPHISETHLCLNFANWKKNVDPHDSCQIEDSGCLKTKLKIDVLFATACLIGTASFLVDAGGGEWERFEVWHDTWSDALHQSRCMANHEFIQVDYLVWKMRSRKCKAQFWWWQKHLLWFVWNPSMHHCISDSNHHSFLEHMWVTLCHFQSTVLV